MHGSTREHVFQHATRNQAGRHLERVPAHKINSLSPHKINSLSHFSRLFPNAAFSFRSPELREQCPDARSLGGGVWPQGRYELKRDMWTSKVTVEWEGPRDYEIRGRRFLTYEKNYFETNDDQPADSKFQGEAGCRIELEDRRLYLRTTIDLRSDQEQFYATFTREIFENDILVRKKQWKETFLRRFQ